MQEGRTLYPCRCGGIICEQWDRLNTYLNCDGCDRPIPSVVLPRIYIVGKAGSGKTYISNIIKKTYPEYRNVVIAEPLYEIVNFVKMGRFRSIIDLLIEMELNEYEAINISKDILYDIPIDAFYEVKPRFALQKIGDIIRNCNELALIKYAFIKTLDMPGIIEDVRLVKEADFFHENNFIGIKIIADEEIRYERLNIRDLSSDKKLLNHKTEREINKISTEFIIYNNFKTEEEIANIIKEIIG